MDWEQSVYSAIEVGRRAINFDRADTLTQLFGLHHWEFMHPDNEIPDVEALPNKTKKLALLRIKEGKSPRQDNLPLSREISLLIRSGSLPEEFTASDIRKLLPIEIRKRVENSRITDAIRRSTLNTLIEETGDERGRRKLYRLK